MHTEKRKKIQSPGWYTRLMDLYGRHQVLFPAVLALVLTLLIEMMSRHSPWKGIVFLFSHPLNFLVNALIILTSLSLCSLFKKRNYFLTLFTCLWLGLGITNCIVRSYRNTPLEAVDFSVLPSAISILDIYLDTWVIVLLFVLLILALVALVWAFFRAKKYTPGYKRTVAFVLLCACLTALGYGLTVWGHREDRSETYSNIVNAYDHYGFVYCFGTGAVDRGIDKPDLYSRQTMSSLRARLHAGKDPEVRPDIIMVQLESFFDVENLDDVSYEEDPIPVFHSLENDFTSGYLTVPSVGAGTANTEFEVLSGMNLAFFGMGEYPYMTILKEVACETVCTDLKDLGYRTHAIHNNTGTFYRRNEIFAQLGFDTFTSLEFMNNIEYNPIGWAKDKVLTGEILKALDSSEEPHFVFTITVQGHGKYQRGVDSQETEALNIVWEEDREEEGAFAYYLSQLKETDAFIGELVQALEQRGKPTMLVLYGDHLPSFDIGSEQLKNKDIFQTQYVIWNNMDLPVSDGNLQAYQLSSETLKECGMSGGLLSQYHQQMKNRRGYQEGLQLLEYDALYGNNYCYGGENPYTSTDLQMGLYPIVISGASWEEGVLTVTGENFTTASRVFVDGEELETTLTEDGSLTAERKEEPESGSSLTVRQFAFSKAAYLAESEPYLWQ